MDGALTPEQLRLQARARALAKDHAAGRAAEIDETRDGHARAESPTGGKTARRQARQAAALRQNLKRRKAQGRARDAADADGGSGAGAVETP